MPEDAHKPPPVAIVVSRYNASITDALEAGARDEYARRGGDPADLSVLPAPGTFELTVLASAAAQRFAAVVALGCVVKGETSHDQHLASAVAHGLTDVSVRTGTPVAFGVLTVDTVEQARERAGGRQGNKGAEAMSAVLDTLESLRALESGKQAASSQRPDKAGAR